MWDLVDNPDSIAFIESFYNFGKPVAAVCHSPGVFHRVMYKGEPLVKGNGLTGFTTGEEGAMKLIDVVPFLIENNSKRFPDTKGWAYAVFDYDPASDTFKPDASGVLNCGFACHTRVAAKDYIFTAYGKRLTEGATSIGEIMTTVTASAKPAPKENPTASVNRLGERFRASTFTRCDATAGRLAAFEGLHQP
jgi:putative intracellular protease/amidase